MALMEAPTDSGEALRSSRSEVVSGVSALAIDVSSMPEPDIHARLREIAAAEASIGDVIDVHQTGSSSELHIGLSATRGVVAPLSGPNAKL